MTLHDAAQLHVGDQLTLQGFGFSGVVTETARNTYRVAIHWACNDGPFWYTYSPAREDVNWYWKEITLTAPYWHGPCPT